MNPANTEKPTKKKPAKRRAIPQPPAVPLMAMDMDSIAKSLSCSVPVVYDIINEGLLLTFTVGRRRYASPQAVADCVKRLEAKITVLPAHSGFNNNATPRPAEPEAA